MLDMLFDRLPLIGLAIFLLCVSWPYLKGIWYELETPVRRVRASSGEDDLEARIREAEGHLHVAEQAGNLAAQASARSRLRSYHKQLRDHQKVISEHKTEAPKLPEAEQVIRRSLRQRIEEEEILKRFASSEEDEAVEVHEARLGILRKEL